MNRGAKHGNGDMKMTESMTEGGSYGEEAVAKEKNKQY